LFQSGVPEWHSEELPLSTLKTFKTRQLFTMPFRNTALKQQNYSLGIVLILFWNHDIETMPYKQLVLKERQKFSNGL
jgi:hypothetical protein